MKKSAKPEPPKTEPETAKTFDPARPEPPFRAWIKNLQQHLRESDGRKTSIDDLVALSPSSDPFYIGGLQEGHARWFADLWHRLNLGGAAHLRRVHYRTLDLANFLKPDGMPYQNLKPDWLFLQTASKYARILRLVPANQFEDHRNPDPILPAWIENLDMGSRPYIAPADVGSFSLPEIWLGICRLPTIEAPVAYGYSANDYADRPVYCEVWCEKTSVDDVLVPLCTELGVAFVPGAGVQSITASVNMLQRVQKLNKPGRVVYISDHDPQGKHMPAIVARHLEFWRRYYAPESDVRLQPLALTPEQVVQFKLPKNVIGGKSKANWEKTEGKGGVELDALEGHVPGELERLIRAALAPYRDKTLSTRLHKAHEKAKYAVEQEWSAATAEIEDELENVRDEVKTIVAKYEPRVTALNEKLGKELRPYQEQLETLRSQFVEAANEFHVELPERPAPKIKPDEKDWLFDSSRSYLEQLRFYKARKDGTLGGKGKR